MKIHVIHEIDAFKGRPFGCTYIRLIRPLLHHTLHQKIQVSFGNDLEKGDYDCVIVERMWRPDLNEKYAELLIRSIRKSGASFVYTLDDNLLDFNDYEEGPITSLEKISAIRLFVREADLVIVSTANLAQRIKSVAKRTLIIPNAIDEDLFFGDHCEWPAKLGSSNLQHIDATKITIGYVGTPTHAEDIRFILEPIRAILSKYRNDVNFIVVRDTGNDQLNEALSSSNSAFISPGNQTEYPHFVRWMRQFCAWDIGISPLIRNPLNHCKSDIKFLDYSALRIPGVFSNVGQYPDTLTGHQMGILADQPEDWFAALELLINNSTIRDAIRAKAEDYTKKHRTLSTCAHHWYDALLSATESV